ncbi:hypothetical protein Y032_0030g2100 [Ancylostoma ceylanicum]|uniref:Uncharacterized protein n=1 Tax=Ancylostoma ceylanicum TaxID=53326 RepID=A0A016URS5_9BILA|nr:hypothetical protein Y032_0030g2100 [Ancylostoma ceylanicum]
MTKPSITILGDTHRQPADAAFDLADTALEHKQRRRASKGSSSASQPFLAECPLESVATAGISTLDLTPCHKDFLNWR